MSEDEIINAEFTKEIATIDPPTTGLAARFNLSTTEGMEVAIATVTNAIVFVDKILTVALKTARISSIYDYDNVPYFSEAECMRLLRLVGGGDTQLVKFSIDKEDDGNWGATAIVRISHPLLGTIDGLGYAHSTDAFLGTNAGTSRRKLDKVSRHNLRQHAFTRAKGAAIREMLDLKNRTWDDLIALGLDRKKAGAMIEHKKPQRPQHPQTAPSKPASTAKPKSDVPPALVAKLKGFTANKIFSWSQISSVQKDLELTSSRALELGQAEMETLVKELDKRAAELGA